jgi:hypothetical protein
VLTNALGVATERADTRSWATLPAGIDLAVIHAPAGSTRVTLVEGDSGSRRELATVNLSLGGWHFLSSRLSP